jgi:hypothetical protein
LGPAAASGTQTASSAQHAAAAALDRAMASLAESISFHETTARLDCPAPTGIEAETALNR